MERVLFETDAPYAFLEGSTTRQGEPADVAAVARFVAELRGVSFEEMARVSTENAHRLFRSGRLEASRHA